MKQRILVVDDDPDIREILALVLDSEGLDILTARDGTDALEVLRREPEVALIILDLMMPRMSGPELVRVLRKDAALAQIPIVVLSGDVSGAKLAAGLSVAAYLAKPVELGALSRVIRDVALVPEMHDKLSR
jgi:CheY-like chemotaxis protein